MSALETVNIAPEGLAEQKGLLDKALPGLKVIANTGKIDLGGSTLPDWATKLIVASEGGHPDASNILQTKLMGAIIGQYELMRPLTPTESSSLKRIIEPFLKKHEGDFISATMEAYGLDAKNITVTLPNGTEKSLSQVLIELRTQKALKGITSTKQ